MATSNNKGVIERYNYGLSDHLGNVRAVISKDSDLGADGFAKLDVQSASPIWRKHKIATGSSVRLDPPLSVASSAREL